MKFSKYVFIAPLFASVSTAAFGQAVQEIEVTDGTNATCVTEAGVVLSSADPACGFFTVPTIDIYVQDAANNTAEILAQADRIELETANAAGNGQESFKPQTARRLKQALEPES